MHLHIYFEGYYTLTMRPKGSHVYDWYIKAKADPEKVLAIDLETLVDPDIGFLTGERIIAVSVSLGYPEIKTEVFVSNGDTHAEENRILHEFDSLLSTIDPEVIIGYNHTGYDLPLLQLKTRNRQYDEQLWNLKYYLGTSYTLDMMYVIAHDLQDSGDRYRIWKLKDAVNHSAYANLPLMRVKELAGSESMNKGEVIRNLWKDDPENFLRYCRGDTHDILRIYHSIFSA